MQQAAFVLLVEKEFAIYLFSSSTPAAGVLYTNVNLAAFCPGRHVLNASAVSVATVLLVGVTRLWVQIVFLGPRGRFDPQQEHQRSATAGLRGGPTCEAAWVQVRESLMQRATEFNILLDDVAITHLSFGTEVSP